MNMLKKLILLILSLAILPFMFASCDSLTDGLNNLFGGETSDTTDGDDTGDGSDVIKSEYTVTFDSNGGSAVKSMVIKAGKKCYEPYSPVKLGAELEGWTHNGKLWNFAKDTVNADMTLVAKWKLTDYKIIYDLGGGIYNGNMPTTFNIETDTITLGTPTRENYEFVGWEINGKRTNEIPKGTTSDVSAVAIWHGLEAVVMPAKGGADGIVVFIHDDARLGTMEIFDSLLEKYGMVGDVGFLLNKVYNNGTVNESALASYETYINNGRWSIVNHSNTHTWWGSEVTENGTTFLKEDAAKMQEELVFSGEKLRELFPGQRVLTFAYPGFSSYEYKYDDVNPNILRDVIYSPTARRLIDTHYISGRMYSGGATKLSDGFTEWSYLNAQFLSDSYINQSLNKLLEDTVKDGLLNVLSFHGLTNDESVYNSDPGYYVYGDSMDKALGKIDEYVKEGKIWNAHYEDAVLYLREAQTAKTVIERSGENILLTLTDEMDNEIYNAAITVRVKNFGNWEAATITQDGAEPIKVIPITENGETYLQFDLVPDTGVITISPATK